MKKLIIALCAFFSVAIAPAFAQAGDAAIVGPAVSGKLEGSHTVSYIPFTKGAGATPVIATESFAMPRGGATLGGHFNLNGIAADKKLWLSKYTSGTGHKDAPTILDSSSQYLLVGGREYSVGSVRGIGFGYVGNATDTAPGFIGIKEVGADKSTNADLIFATRASTANVPLDVRLSITTVGQITAADGYAPKSGQDLATKAYVDSAGSGGSVPFDQSMRLVDKRPSDSADKCRKGDLNIDELSAATYAYLCVGDNWRRIRLDLF